MWENRLGGRNEKLNRHTEYKPCFVGINEIWNPCNEDGGDRTGEEDVGKYSTFTELNRVLLLSRPPLDSSSFARSCFEINLSKRESDSPLCSHRGKIVLQIPGKH